MANNNINLVQAQQITDSSHEEESRYAELSERCLHEVATCEAGYIVVAAVLYRVPLGARIMRDPVPAPNERAMWTSQTCGLPKRQEMPEVGMAGAAAQMLLENPGVTPDDVGNYVDIQYGPPGAAFTTLMLMECELIGDALGSDKLIDMCARTLGILREHHEFLAWVVKQLREKHAITPTEVAHYLTCRLDFVLPDTSRDLDG